MRDSYNCRASIESGEDGCCHVVSLSDFGWGAIDGATLAEAWGLLPGPSPAGRRRPLVVPPVETALKAALYKAWRGVGILQRRLVRDLDVAEREVRRMLYPDHATKAATIERALRRLGKRLTVTIGEMV